ncbi:hypothetical protein BH09MYX1_BH09MYX1_11230 [soil metagenome]
MRDASIAHIRVDTELIASTCELIASADETTLRFGDLVLRPADISAVWYRRPMAIQVAGDGDRYDRAFAAAEWTAAIEGFLNQIPRRRWINHPAAIVGASAKLEQLKRAKDHGLSVPEWCCTSRSEHAANFVREHRHVIAKPLYAGYIERGAPAADTVIYTTRVTIDEVEAAGPNLGAPTLFQAEVVGGADVRITVVDDEAVAVRMSRDGGDVDIRKQNMIGVSYAAQQLPAQLHDVVRGLVRSYGLRFAALDMMFVDANWYFLEINPNGQWAWLDLVGGTEIYRAFIETLKAAS